MGLFPQAFIDDLRLQANILQVVQEVVPLKKAGSSYKGNCPFHNEKTPSFHVHPDKGFFHCFGCGAGGDVFKFVELHEKVAFPDAVRMLAHTTSGRDGLVAHREIAVPRVRRRELGVGMAVGGNRLPEGIALVRLDDGRAAADTLEWGHDVPPSLTFFWIPAR